MSATAIILAWLGKNSSNEIRLEELKKEAKGMGLKLLRNKDKNTFIGAVASTLMREKKVLIPSEVSLNKVTQEDVSMCRPWGFTGNVGDGIYTWM